MEMGSYRRRQNCRRTDRIKLNKMDAIFEKMVVSMVDLDECLEKDGLSKYDI